MKLLAIDGNSILNRAFFGVHPLSTKDGVYTNAIFGFLNILLKLEREHQPDATAIAFDVSRKNFRHEQYADYKANRKGMPEELAVQLPLMKELLTCMGYTLASCEGFEGDDILGTLSARCVSRGDVCVIATGDRDCLQLVSEQVTVSLAKTKDTLLYTPEKVREDYGFDPIHIIDLKALMGDASDNIPGVKGVGEKTALSLVGKYGELEIIYQDLDALEATPRVRKLLAEGRESAFLSKRLATIVRDAPIETELSAYVKRPADEAALGELLRRLELYSFFEKLNLTSPEAAPQAETVSPAVLSGLAALKQQSPSGWIGLLPAGEGLQISLPSAVAEIPPEEREQALAFLAGLPGKRLCSFMAKPLYKLARGLSLEGFRVDFDGELAAYLLSPSAKGYDLRTLANRYLPGRQYEVPENLTEAALLPDLCQALEKALCADGLTWVMEEIELPLCRVLADMELEGFAMDRQGVEAFGERLSDGIDRVTEEIYRQAGEPFNINSTRDLGNILFEKLGLPAGKKTKTGYSTNVEVLEGLLDKHPIVPQILEYRQLTKLHSTYVVGLLKVIGPDGRVRSTFNQTETRTGRISSTEPNVQNIPVRTPLGSEMRRFFVAREGYTLVDADYSQIELRILAHIANDEQMIRAFREGADIHAITASQVFGHPLETLPSYLRSRAKAINFGIVYGIGAYSLSQQIGVSVAEAREYIAAYLRTYSGVAAYQKEVVEKARADGYVSTIYGRRRDLADIASTNKTVRAFAERVALNMPVQGTAADIIKLAMIRVHDRIRREGLEARLILQVHDELIVEAPVLQESAVKRLLREEMEQAAQLRVPLLADVHAGRTWYDAKE